MRASTRLAVSIGVLACAARAPEPPYALVLRQPDAKVQPSRFEVVSNPGKLSIAEIKDILATLRRSRRDLPCTKTMVLPRDRSDRTVEVYINRPDRCSPD
jgi:hypothetical protein